MNPVDHPMGGGEGRSSVDIHVHEMEYQQKVIELVLRKPE
jgi:ribosomal protein L2